MGQADDMCITVAWDQAPHWGKKKKINVGEKKNRKKSRAVVWEGERVAAFPPSPGHRWARFGRQHFSYLTPFFAFFPHCGAWSQASITVVTSELKQRER